MGRKKRVLSGMRPTGPLHLGHFFGALSNWVKMQEEYDCYYFVADWHALTTHYAEDTRLVRQNTREIVLDWLSVGLDPDKCTMFVQSSIAEHAELHLLLSMITPLEWLERVPTYKELISQLREKDLGTYGFLGYPLLQTADIVMYDADLVPVGEDQVPHVELAREVVRRFNFLFGLEVDAEALRAPENLEAATAVVTQAKIFATGNSGTWELASRDASEIAWGLRRLAANEGIDNFLERNPALKNFVRNRQALAEPGAMLTETPRFPGTDGRRMAKSFGNAIWLKDDPETIQKKALGMMTDPQRVRRTDPGRPEICPVFAYHKLFSEPEKIAWSENGCRTAGIGCVECKRAMADSLVKWIAPVHQRRKLLEAQPERVNEILENGSKQARKVARRTMRRVRDAIFGPPLEIAATPPGAEKPAEPLWSESD